RRPPDTMFVLPHLGCRARDKNHGMSRALGNLTKDFQRFGKAYRSLNRPALVWERSRSTDLVLLWLFLRPVVFGSRQSCRMYFWADYYPVHLPISFLRLVVFAPSLDFQKPWHQVDCFQSAALRSNLWQVYHISVLALVVRVTAPTERIVPWPPIKSSLSYFYSSLFLF